VILKPVHNIVFFMLIISSVSGYGQNLPYACAGNTESYGVHGNVNSVFLWEVDGGNIVSGQGNDTIAIQWNYERRSHTITVTEQSEHGCFSIPVTSNLDINAPVADIGDEAEVCEDDVFTFDATTNYPASLSYLWSDNSTGATYMTGEAGTYWVRITGADGCSDYDSVTLTVNPLPVVNLGNDTSLCGNSAWYISAGDFASYRWSTGDIVNPLYVTGERTSPETVWVEVTDYKGCTGSDTLILEVCDAYILFSSIPNTITPGGNDQNEKWIIPNIELFPQAVVEIYDRWGRLIWRTDDIANNPWNGESMSGKEMPMDAYYYVLDIKVAGVEPITGYINVVR
jgi:gliding motility-associated-like protein